MGQSDTIKLSDVVGTQPSELGTDNWVDYISQLEKKCHFLGVENQELKAYIDSFKGNRYQIVSFREAIELYLMPDFKGKIYVVGLMYDPYAELFEELPIEDIKWLLTEEGSEDKLAIIDYTSEE